MYQGNAGYSGLDYKDTSKHDPAYDADLMLTEIGSLASPYYIPSMPSTTLLDLPEDVLQHLQRATCCSRQSLILA